jgi:hypothetical protein
MLASINSWCSAYSQRFSSGRRATGKLGVGGAVTTSSEITVANSTRRIQPLAISSRRRRSLSSFLPMCYSTKLRALAFVLVLVSGAVMRIESVGAQRGNRQVPPNTRYVVVDDKGKKTRGYKEGEAMPLVMDGAYREVKCSKQIRSASRHKAVKCWRVVGSS